jgi:hypothetical protein
MQSPDKEQPHIKANSTKEIAPRLMHADVRSRGKHARPGSMVTFDQRLDSTMVERHGRIERMDCTISNRGDIVTWSAFRSRASKYTMPSTRGQFVYTDNSACC